MNWDVVVTCAVTGAGDTVGKSKHLPVTPADIARAAVEAAKAGASCAHIHVRDPALFREVVQRVRDSGTDMVINLTAGMGGDWTPSTEDWAMPGPGTDCIGPDERLTHVKDCLPEICSLDCGTLNFGNDNSIYISTPPILRRTPSPPQSTGARRAPACWPCRPSLCCRPALSASRPHWTRRRAKTACAPLACRSLTGGWFRATKSRRQVCRSRSRLK